MGMSKLFLRAILVSLTLFSCTQQPETRLIPLYENLSQYHRMVSTKSPEAQKYFDQGFTLYYGFNHEAAITSFQQAVALDSM